MDLEKQSWINLGMPRAAIASFKVFKKFSVENISHSVILITGSLYWSDLWVGRGEEGHLTGDVLAQYDNDSRISSVLSQTQILILISSFLLQFDCDFLVSADNLNNKIHINIIIWYSKYSLMIYWCTKCECNGYVTDM